MECDFWQVQRLIAADLALVSHCGDLTAEQIGDVENEETPCRCCDTCLAAAAEDAAAEAFYDEMEAHYAD